MNQPQTPRALRSALFLLVVSVTINYIDRGNLSIAAPLLQSELGLSASKLGILLSSFFWTYAIFQIPSGWLADHLDGNWVLAGGFLLWSVATAVTGLVGGFGALLVLRMLVGAGESVAYPCYSRILCAHFDENGRGMANTLIDNGAKIGPMLGTLFGGLLVAWTGWRPFFLILGIVALVWLPFWIRLMPRQNRIVEDRMMERPGFLEILSHREVPATFAGHFCANYFWYFLLTWLPFYLVRERGMSMQSMALAGGLAYLFIAAGTAAAGWLSYRAIESGAPAQRVRRVCAGFGLGLSSIVVAVPAISGEIASMAVLVLACVSFGVYTSSFWAMTQTLAGPLAAGRWSGMQNFTANLAGVAAPALTGLVVDRTGHFFWAFAVAAAAALGGAVIYAFWLGPIESARWKCQEAA